MSVYTRTGDNGTTSLFGGKRVLKCEELVSVCGSVDELNSWIGLLTSYREISGIRRFLREVQSDLFVIGSVLAGGEGDLKQLGKRVSHMEARIDSMEKGLPKLHNFILPGGSVVGGFVHVSRSICRRAERQVVALGQRKKVDKRIIVYLNRLSDLLFVLARFINKNAHVGETTWTGTSRQKH